MANAIQAALDATASGGIRSKIPALHDADSSEVARLRTANHLERRLRLAALLLGLEDILPNDWIEATTEGFDFRRLTLRQADHLVRALEDLAIGRPAPSRAPGPGQLWFWAYRTR